MVDDARFEDADDAPLRLLALDSEDLKVISALVQDSVFPASEMQWDRRARRFAILLNRFRWEVPERTGRRTDFERVQSVLVVEDVMKVASTGIDRRDPNLVLSLLAVTFEPGPDGTGRVLLALAGDGDIALEVETLEVRLKDVTRPYVAPSHHMPQHPLD